MTETEQAVPAGTGDAELPAFAREASAVVASFGTDESAGLTASEAASRLSRYGPNEITSEKPPSVWAIALAQLRDPMNIMLVAVAVVSLAIGEVPTALLVR